MNYTNALQKVIKSHLVKLDLSVSDLADHLEGMKSRNLYRKLNNETANINIELLCEIACVFNKDAFELLKEAENLDG